MLKYRLFWQKEEIRIHLLSAIQTQTARSSLTTIVCLSLSLSLLLSFSMSLTSIFFLSPAEYPQLLIPACLSPSWSLLFSLSVSVPVSLGRCFPMCLSLLFCLSVSLSIPLSPPLSPSLFLLHSIPSYLPHSQAKHGVLLPYATYGGIP